MRYKYDELQRLTHLYMQGGDYEEEILAECTVYGEKHPQAAEKNKNLRGQVYQLFDAAGVVTNSEYNFIEYGNGVTTKYDYYRDTFHLHKMFTYREVGSWLQNLHYSYDPVGNITQIQDDAPC